MRPVSKWTYVHHRLKQLYEQRSGGMSQDEFGLEYGIGTQGMVSQYLIGRRPLNLDAAVKFARGLNCTIYDICPEMAESVRHEILPVLGLTSATPVVPINMGTRIRARKEELGLSSTDLARAAGVTVAAVLQWESGETNNLKHEQLFAIADILKIDARKLALGDGADAAAAATPIPANTFVERLQSAARYANTNPRQSAIADAFGLNRQTVNRWFRGGKPNAELTLVIAKKWGVDPYWLNTGLGQMNPRAAPPVSKFGDAGDAVPPKPMPTHAFAERLRSAAHYAIGNSRQSAIADAVGLTRQTVHAWFKGSKPTAELMAIIATKWGVDLSWLATGQGQMIPRAVPPKSKRNGS